MTTNYDNISDDYLKLADHPIKQYSEAFTMTRVLGNIKAKAVLDLACGDGYYTRLIKQQGAAPVVGVDISEKMIAKAKQIELAAPLDIEYRTGDVTRLDLIGQFDVVIGVFLFPYAATKQILTAMFQTIYDNLKPTGRLVALTTDPTLTETDLPVFSQYGVRMVVEAGLQDGVPLTATITVPDGSSIELHTFFWQEASYESASRQAGFESLRWHPIQVSPEGRKKYGEPYWQAYSTKPYGIILECYKAR